jgi:hypothetical protein
MKLSAPIFGGKRWGRGRRWNVSSWPKFRLHKLKQNKTSFRPCGQNVSAKFPDKGQQSKSLLFKSMFRLKSPFHTNARVYFQGYADNKVKNIQLGGVICPLCCKFSSVFFVCIVTTSINSLNSNHASLLVFRSFPVYHILVTQRPNSCDYLVKGRPSLLSLEMEMPFTSSSKLTQSKWLLPFCSLSLPCLCLGGERRG